jgi:hypothetical protein
MDIKANITSNSLKILANILCIYHFQILVKVIKRVMHADKRDFTKKLCLIKLKDQMKHLAIKFYSKWQNYNIFAKIHKIIIKMLKNFINLKLNFTIIPKIFSFFLCKCRF